MTHYGKSASDAESVVASIRAQGGLADSIAADLATSNGAVVLANEVRKILGDRLDILVANAGVSKSATSQITQSPTSTVFSRQTYEVRSS